MSLTYLVCDTETTGLDAGRKAVEIAVRRIDEDLNTLAEWSSLIDPEKPIDQGAQNIHGISAEMVANAPTMDEFVTHILGKPFDGELCVIGHNVVFDIPMLHKLGDLKYSICTLELARTHIQGPTNYKLGTLREFFGIPKEGDAHRALADVHTAHEVLKRILPLTGRSLEQVAKTEAHVVHYMTFGKHSGKPLFELPMSYISWLLALPDLDPNLRSSLETARLLKQ